MWSQFTNDHITIVSVPVNDIQINANLIPLEQFGFENKNHHDQTPSTSKEENLSFFN